MAEVFALDKNNNYVATMSKEEIIAAIQTAAAGGSFEGFENCAFVSCLKEKNKNASFSFWVGTQAEYNAIEEHEKNVLYLISDDPLRVDLFGDVAFLKDKTQENANQIVVINGNIVTINRNIATNATNISNLQTAHAGTLAKANANAANITTLQTTVKGVQTSVSGNTKNISANAANIKTLQTKVATNETNITALQTKANTNATNITALQTKANTNATNITALQTKANANESSAKANAANITTLQTKANTNATDIAALKKDLTVETLFTNASGATVAMTNKAITKFKEIVICYAIYNNDNGSISYREQARYMTADIGSAVQLKGSWNGGKSGNETYLLNSVGQFSITNTTNATTFSATKNATNGQELDYTDQFKVLITKIYGVGLK